MNRFESFLAQQFEDYMTYRHQLGYDTDNTRWALKTVERYLVTQNAGPNDLTPAFFLSLQADLHMQNKSINRLLCCTRKLFEYLVRIEYCRDNPLRDIPWLPEEHFIPFIFSPPQIDELLAAVCRRLRKNSKDFVQDLGSYLAILLLARCGMRISEPLRLLRHQFRTDDNTLYIEKTKFKKDRLIPIPKAVAAEITNYLAVHLFLITLYQTDSFGIVHHARYLEIMEEARWLYCYENNLMEAFHQKGIIHVIVNINIDYKDSVRFGDMITIETEVFRVTEKSVTFRQVVSRDEQRLVVTEITNVFMRKADHSVIKVTELKSFWDDLKRDKNLLLANLGN